jgi:6-phosphogluconolactonase
MKKINLILNTLAIMISLCSCHNETIRLFAGSFTESGENGFNILDLNREAGTFKILSESDAGPNPSYFCISEKKKMIYVANEVMEFKGVRGGGVTTLKYDALTGSAEKINEISTPAGSPCFISLSPEEDFLLLANYTGGSVTVVRLDEMGIPLRITDTIFYEGIGGTVSHPHMISYNPAGDKVYLTDLGLDQIVIFDFEKVAGQLKQIPGGIVKLPEGAGPRHFVFNSDGTKMYVICELNSTITVFNVEANGILKPIQTVTTLSEGFTAESFCADIHLGKSGEFLYGSNRGENTLVTFRIGYDGTLTLAGHTQSGGNWPRNFVIDPSGKYILAGNQRSGNISLFKIDKKTGMPEEKMMDFNIASPACLKFADIK